MVRMDLSVSAHALRRLVVGDGDDLSTVARALYRLRYVAVLVLALTTGLVQWVLGIALPLPVLGVVMLLLALYNLAIGVRLRRAQSVSAAELLLHLGLDVLTLLATLYVSGGSGNPFVSFFLLPLVVAAVALPGRYVLALALATLACYTLLLFFHWPLPSDRFNLHVIGMWFNFVLSAALIVAVVTRMARHLRQQDAALAASREKVLRDEHIVALGTLAAGAAHELGTPLNTMAVLAADCERALAGQPELAADMRCLREQIASCKTTLTRLRDYDIEATDRQPVHADRVLRDVLDAWSRVRPTVPVAFHWQGPAPRVRVGAPLTQTLSNLVNNAADASPAGIEVRARVEGRQLLIDILDSGPGIGPDVAARAGKLPVSTKADGHGVGLLLANATIERLGGTVSVRNRAAGGACTRVALPLDWPDPP